MAVTSMNNRVEFKGRGVEVFAMSLATEKEMTVLRGRVTGGVILLDDAAALPEGTAVTVIASDLEMPVQMRREFAAWDQAGADAWKLVTAWEDEEGHGPETLA